MRLLMILFFLMSQIAIAASPILPPPPTTTRIMQFSNDKVTVWETIIYPSTQQTLKMHRHDHDRVVVALTDGLLKITNDKGKIHYLKLEKDKAYYLTKDVPNELHSDQNMTSHTIKVLVMELMS